MMGQAELVWGRAGLGQPRGRKGWSRARAGPGTGQARPWQSNFFSEVRRPQSSKSARVYAISGRGTEEKKLPGRAPPGLCQGRRGLSQARAREDRPEVGPGRAGLDQARQFFSRKYGKRDLMTYGHIYIYIYMYVHV